MRYRFVTADVFTDTAFGGNPLAVFPEAEGLSDELMQALAREFNLSETTFVLPPKDPANTAEVRIFTPQAEMPFAGHPNVGTAFVLARLGGAYGKPLGDAVRFEEKAGLVPIELLAGGDGASGARLKAPQAFQRSAEVAAARVAAAVGLPEEAIVTDRHAPCIASCGAPFLFAELAGAGALAAARPDAALLAAALPDPAVNGIHLYCAGEEPNLDYQSRMFAPHHGIPEDPATGSANVALAGLLASLLPDDDANLSLTILQGAEMGRPSYLDAQAERRGGTVTGTWIAGQCRWMMEGFIDL